MTEEQIVERVAQALREELAYYEAEAPAEDLARAVVALLGPAPLEWRCNPSSGSIHRTRCDNGYRTVSTDKKYAMAFVNGGGHGEPIYQWATNCGGWSGAYATFEAACSGADAHHRAAWLAQTVAGRAE